MKLVAELRLRILDENDDVQEASDDDVRDALESVPWCVNCDATAEPTEDGECSVCGHCVGFRPEGSL